MTDHDDLHSDPIKVEQYHRDDDPDLDADGPPVAQMASTYGSSFVRDAEQAERIGKDATPDPDERVVSVENQDGPTSPG